MARRHQTGAQFECLLPHEENPKVMHERTPTHKLRTSRLLNPRLAASFTTTGATCYAGYSAACGHDLVRISATKAVDAPMPVWALWNNGKVPRQAGVRVTCRAQARLGAGLGDGDGLLLHGLMRTALKP